jgi:hypothetical protein
MDAARVGSNAHLRRRAPYNPVFPRESREKNLALEAGLTAAFPHPVSELLSRELRPGDCGRGGLRHCIFPEILLQ